MPSRRSDRALTNDSLIRSTTIELILSKGIDAISFREVGKKAGLTHGALYARFEDLDELLVDLWCETLSTRAVAMYETTLQAAAQPSEQSVAAVFDIVRHADPTDAATIKVLLLTRRFPILQEEVDGFVHDHLEARPGEISDAVQSRALILFSLIGMKIFANYEFGLDPARLTFLQSVMLETLSIEPSAIPPVSVVEADEGGTLDLEDDIQSRLARATVNAIARSGYTKSTMSRISRRAESSPGAIYKLYSSKEELVIAALRTFRRTPLISPFAFADVLSEGALAQILFSSADEHDILRKNFILEMMMAGAHNYLLRDAVGAQLRSLESMASLVKNVSDEERRTLEYLIREVVLLTLGVGFISTLTKTTERSEFYQFSEPFRRVLLQRLPSWPDISEQIRSFDMDTLPRVTPLVGCSRGRSTTTKPKHRGFTHGYRFARR